MKAHDEFKKKIKKIIFYRVWVDPKTTVRLEVLNQRKIPITQPGIETATCQVVAQCLNLDIRGEMNMSEAYLKLNP